MKYIGGKTPYSEYVCYLFSVLIGKFNVTMTQEETLS